MNNSEFTVWPIRYGRFVMRARHALWLLLAMCLLIASMKLVHFRVPLSHVSLPSKRHSIGNSDVMMLSVTGRMESESSTAGGGATASGPVATAGTKLAADLPVAPGERVAWRGVLHSGDESPRCEPVNVTPPARLDWIVPPEAPFPANCDRPLEGIPELCAALRSVASPRREVLVAVCDSNVLSQLQLFLRATRAAGVNNVLIIALDERLAAFLREQGVAYWLRVDSAKVARMPHAKHCRLDSSCTVGYTKARGKCDPSSSNDPRPTPNPARGL